MKNIYTPKTKKIIFFDMNHTLLDERSTFERSFVEVLRELTARWHSGEEEEADYAKTFRTYTEEWKKGAHPSETVLQRRIRCLGKALQHYPLAVTDSFAHRFFNEIEDVKRSQLQLFPGVKDTLEQLATSYQLSVISNSSKKVLTQQVERLQLGSFFPPHRLFSAQRPKLRKPDPAMFKRALHKTGMAPYQAVMVGDSWKNDVYGARRSGIDAIWFRPSNKTKWSVKRIGKNKITVIRRLQQLLDIFELNEDL